MSCAGTSCRQGRASCRSPIVCSGAPVDQSIADFRGRPRTFTPDFGIEGPDDSDFLKQDNALAAALRWGAQPLLAAVALICLAFSLGYLGRYLGLL